MAGRDVFDVGDKKVKMAGGKIPHFLPTCSVDPRGDEAG